MSRSEDKANRRDHKPSSAETTTIRVCASGLLAPPNMGLWKTFLSLFILATHVIADDGDSDDPYVLIPLHGLGLVAAEECLA